MYKGRMLELAWDLGKRFLPAFRTPTGIPYSRVNLRYGLEKNESPETCSWLRFSCVRAKLMRSKGTTGAGSLILEFAVLSRLTGDGRFEVGLTGSCRDRCLRSKWQDLARQAYLALWNRRSPHNLLGNTIGVTHGQWLAPGLSGVGAGMDSFFEYGIKAAILLGVSSTFPPCATQ